MTSTLQTSVAECTHKIVVCNAYPSSSPMNGYIVTEHAHRIFKHLEYKVCTDMPLAVPNGKLEFVVEGLQVAAHKYDTRQFKHDSVIVLVIYRDDVNSLRASMLMDSIILDAKHPQLLVFNAYTGSKFLQLQAAFDDSALVENMHFNKRYRADPQDYRLTLTDGFEKMTLGFNTKPKGLYIVFSCGVDPGFRGMPHPLGMVAHSVDAFTISVDEKNRKPVPKGHENDDDEAGRDDRDDTDTDEDEQAGEQAGADDAEEEPKSQAVRFGLAAFAAALCALH